jgi:hypothetical protein
MSPHWVRRGPPPSRPRTPAELQRELFIAAQRYTSNPQLPVYFPQELYDHLQTYFALPKPRPIFDFLHNTPSWFPRELRARYLGALQPRTELQVEYFLETETHADDWCVTFPNFKVMDIFDRDTAARVDRASKTTWRQFRESDVAELFMHHIDTVTFAADWNTPSRMHVVVKFTLNSHLRTSIVYNHFEEAYERLDLEYIKLELKRVTQYWRECWKPAAMTYEVIHIMAADLRKMYNEMVW